MTTSDVDVTVLGKPVTFPNGMTAPNVFLKVSLMRVSSTCDSRLIKPGYCHSSFFRVP